MTRYSLALLCFWCACTSKQPEPPAASHTVPAAKPGWPTLDESFIEQSAATLNFRLGRPQPLAIAPDGSVLFRRTGPRDRRSDLYLLDPGGAERTLVTVESLLSGGSEQLTHEEQARRERTRTATSGIVDIDLSSDGQRILLSLGARVFVFDRTRGQAREIELGGDSAFDPHLAPDGKHVSFVRDGDLWLAAVDAGPSRPQRLTQHPADREYGVAEFVAQEELDRTRGYFWSPDSRWLAFQRTDARAVDTLYVADAAHPERTPTAQKYPRAGTSNAVVDLGIVAADGGTPRWVSWDQAQFPYLARVTWTQGAPLCLTLLNRAQTVLVLLAVDPATGATRELLRVEDPAWVNLPPGAPSWLEDGSGFLWLSESEPGYALELRAPDGALLRTLAAADAGVRTIVGSEPAGKAAIVTGSRDPREQHVWRVPLLGSSDLAALTQDGGVHEAQARHGVVVLSSALREGGSATTVIAADGRRHQLPSVAEQPQLSAVTQLESVAANGATLYTAITRPRTYEPGRKYPVLLKVYGGPHAQTVQDYRGAYRLDQWYADAGFIVVRIDGRGTPHRGRSWERALAGELASVPLTDQVAGLEALSARHPELDRTRVGVFGWSFGGYLAAIAVLMRPDVFHAAVAGAPVTDWSLYDTAYTERYMKLPAEHADDYRRASALTYAHSLTRPLLLMHGLTDDNVHFAHSLALIEALYAAGKRAEVVALSTTHMVTDPKLALAREKLQVEFFRQKLGL